jgi:hypothetical protein
MPTDFTLQSGPVKFQASASANGLTEMALTPLCQLLRDWKVKVPALQQFKLVKADPPAVDQWSYSWKLASGEKWQQTLQKVNGAFRMNFACDFFDESSFIPQREVRAIVQGLILAFDITKIVADW